MGAAVASAISRVGRLIPRRLPARSTSLYAAWTLAWFLVFLVLTFPHDLVLRRWIDRLATHSGWKIDYARVWLRPWSGVNVSDLRLTAPGKDPDPLVTATTVALRPSFSALIVGGTFPLGFAGRAYHGTFSGWMNSVNPLAMDAVWNHLSLGEYPRLSRAIDGAWAGDLSGEIHLAPGSDPKTVEGDGKLGLRNGSLTQGKVQGFPIPDLHFGSGTAELEIKGAKLDLKSVKLSGSEIDADLKGQVYVPAPNAAPVVNGTLTVKPLPGGPPGLETLLTLLNHNQKPPSGVYTFTVYGAIDQLRIR